MPSEELPRDADLDELNSKLNEGLKACRSMVENYRAMLTPEEIPALAEPNDGVVPLSDSGETG
jgi:hypothetical protein